MICVDGGQGLIAALPIVYHGLPVQRCWAHTIRNILNKVRVADQQAVKADVHAVMNAPNRRKAETAARRFADRWEPVYPKAVACLRNDLDDLFTCLRSRPSPSRSWSGPPTPSSDGSGRSLRRTRPMGTFQDKTSMDRILYAVFIHENKSQGISTPFSLTHNS